MSLQEKSVSVKESVNSRVATQRSIHPMWVIIEYSESSGSNGLKKNPGNLVHERQFGATLISYEVERYEAGYAYV